LQQFLTAKNNFNQPILKIGNRDGKPILILEKEKRNGNFNFSSGSQNIEKISILIQAIESNNLDIEKFIKEEIECESTTDEILFIPNNNLCADRHIKINKNENKSSFTWKVDDLETIFSKLNIKKNSGCCDLVPALKTKYDLKEYDFDDSDEIDRAIVEELTTKEPMSLKNFSIDEYSFFLRMKKLGYNTNGMKKEEFLQKYAKKWTFA
jgi:hypothetical protein